MMQNLRGVCYLPSFLRDFGPFYGDKGQNLIRLYHATKKMSAHWETIMTKVERFKTLRDELCRNEDDETESEEEEEQTAACGKRKRE